MKTAIWIEDAEIIKDLTGLVQDEVDRGGVDGNRICRDEVAHCGRSLQVKRDIPKYGCCFIGPDDEAAGVDDEVAACWISRDCCD